MEVIFKGFMAFIMEDHTMMEATKVTARPMEAHIPQEIICATKIVIVTLPLYMLAWATGAVAMQVVQGSVQVV